MKVFDCITYFDEPMLFEIRLNILDKYVDQFIVSEATYTHSGSKKKIKFNKDLYPNFKKKIKHVIVDELPKNIIPLVKDDNYKNQMINRINAIRRIEYQRNLLLNGLKDVKPNDWIIYSDSDEIPNLEKVNLSKIKESKLLFKQKMFYYKFNFGLPSLEWFGSKATKYESLVTFSELRNIKPKKYNWWRVDTFFMKNKFIGIKIIEDGGWHFTELKTAEQILEKHRNDEHHDEFDQTGIDKSIIKNMIKNKFIPYNHKIDQKNWKKKWNKANKISLTKIDDKYLPNYIVENKKKYINWFNQRI